MFNMISRYSIPIKKSYSFFRIVTTNYEPMYCGYTLQENASRSIQYRLEFDFNENIKWFQKKEGFFRVEYKNTLDPQMLDEFEARTFVAKEIDKYGGLERQGGELKNKFIPLSKSMVKTPDIGYIIRDMYPVELMRNISHSFSLDTSLSENELIRESKRTNKKMMLPRIKENEKVIHTSKLIVQYELFNFEKEDFDEPRILLEADNGKSFTAIELLYKLHQKLGPILGNQDNRFFEGFTFATDQEPENMGVPIYFLDTGL